MRRWIPALLIFMPRWLASLSTAVLLLLAVSVLAWMALQPTVVAGRLVATAPVGHGDQVLLEVTDPWSGLLHLRSQPEHRLVMADEVLVNQTDPEKVLWVLALGEETRQVNDFTMLEADQLVMLPMPGKAWMLQGAAAELAVFPLVALSVGALLIVAGPLLTRLLSALTLGTLMGIATWHGLYYARFTGEIFLVEPLVNLSAWIAAAVGLVIGLRARRDRLNIVIERLILVVLVILAAPAIAQGLDVPTESMVIGGALFTLLSPVFGYALLGSHALALGLHAGTGAAWFILGLSLLIALVLRSAFTPTSDPVTRRITQYLRPESGRIPLHALFVRGQS